MKFDFLKFKVEAALCSKLPFGWSFSECLVDSSPPPIEPPPEPNNIERNFEGFLSSLLCGLIGPVFWLLLAS